MLFRFLKHMKLSLSSLLWTKIILSAKRCFSSLSTCTKAINCFFVIKNADYCTEINYSRTFRNKVFIVQYFSLDFLFLIFGVNIEE